MYAAVVPSAINDLAVDGGMHALRLRPAGDP